MNENKELLLSTTYLGPIEYYKALANANKVSIEMHEHYVKQSYRNRCKIATANGIMDLSIPIEKANKTYIRDVQISNHGDWQKQHWRAIESAYQSSPFFEYYKDDFHPYFNKEWKFLWDFNLSLQELILGLMDIDIVLSFTTKYDPCTCKTISDLRNEIHPKKIEQPELTTYYQVFENKYGFIPNLSIIDLLFNLGNESILYLKDRYLR